MALVVGSVTYRRVPASLVVDGAGNPVESATGGQVYSVQGGSPLAIAEYPSGVPLTSLSSSALGILPSFYAAFPSGGALEGFVDWPGDSIPPQEISASAAELEQASRAAIAAEMAATRLIAETAQARVEEIARSVGSGGAGGVSDHGALTGLNDDDHLQYARTDGTRGAFAAPTHTHTGYATSQTVTDSSAADRNRSNHYGEQPITSVTGLQDALEGKQARVVVAATLAEANATAVGTLVAIPTTA